jgi:hypothetical protein
VLIDRFLPSFDATAVHEVSVNASPDAAYSAIRAANMRDPVIDFLFFIRELPWRLVRRLRGELQPPTPSKVTFGDLATAGPGWTLLAEDVGREILIGSVGRFWRKDYGGRTVSAETFIPFHEPGYAKLVVGFVVRRAGSGSIVRYEARTATTDESARRKFAIYWLFIAPAVSIVMRRALKRIKAHAEQHAAVFA